MSEVDPTATGLQEPRNNIMSLREEDPKGVVLPKDTPVDEFEPKTGEKEDIIAIGLYVKEESCWRGSSKLY